MTSPLEDYRKHCVSAEQKAQEDFDKTVLSLSGGGLGISFAFIKDFVGPGLVVHKVLLLAAWVAWGTSIVAILASYFFSQLSLRTAIKQIDDGKIGEEYPGRSFAKVTIGLTVAGGLTFLFGVILIVWFVALNFGGFHGSPPTPGK